VVREMKVGTFIDDVTKDPNSPYYIGPINNHHASGGDLRDDANKTADDISTAVKAIFGDDFADFLI
jgi:hypothetical protein